LADLAAPFRAQPGRAALLFDVDGTLAPIVDDPAAARPLPAAVLALTELSLSYRTVAVVSGRPLAFLVEHLPPEIDCSGLYGLEWRRAGEVGEHPEAARWRPVIAEAVDRMAQWSPPNVTVEPKGLSLTVHYRTAPDAEGAVLDQAASVASQLGLRVHTAKMSVELHPPIDADKGTAVRSLAAGVDAVLYAGDDVGDLPAFAVLRELRAAGTITASVAVGGAELPDEVAGAVDIVLDAPADMVDLLGALAPDGGNTRPF
jgi:trehalose 6-phosphate phosphatase